MELNKVMLVGNLGRDPETKFLPSGESVSDFSIAVNRRFRDRQGEMKDDTAWIRIKCFGKLSEFANNYLNKGKAVFVEGRLHENKWEQDGQKRSMIEVIAERVQFAYPKGVESGSSGGGEGYSAAPADRQSDQAPSAAGESNTVDDLPF